MINKTTKHEITEYPLFDFKNKFYTPFNFDTKDISYYITKEDGSTARLILECSGFCIGKIELPIEFLSKLSECKLSPMVLTKDD